MVENFLGDSLWRSPKGEVKRAVSKKARATFKQRIRALTRRSCGRSMNELIEPLRRYLLGWKAYFGLAQTPGIWRGLDEWVRHRLRAIQIKQWKRGKTIYQQLLALGGVSNGSAAGGGEQPSLVAQQSHGA